MKPFKKNTGYNKGGFSRQDHRGPGARQEMFDATCAECSERCQVPFRPNGRKPVLCNNCYGSGGGSERRSEPRFERKDRYESRPRYEKPAQDNSELLKQMRLLNDKMDQILEALLEVGEEEDGE